MSGCEPTETSQLCEHGKAVKFGCSKCYFGSNDESEYSLVIHSMKQTIEMWQKGCEVLISDLQRRIIEIENKSLNKKPHKCPVCDSKGWLLDSYLTDAKKIDCHACLGKGIVWG